MNDNLPVHSSLKSVERLFPFAARSGIVVPGRNAMAWKRRKLLFVLITTDITPGSRAQIQRDFGSLPIVELFTSKEVLSHFGFHNAKVLGFMSCPLARTILREMSEFRIPPPEYPELGQVKMPQPAPTPQPVPATPAPPDQPRLGWRAKRQQQKTERLAEKLKKRPSKKATQSIEPK